MCAKNLAPTGIRSPDCPAHSQSLYRLSYPAHYPKYIVSLQSVPNLYAPSHVLPSELQPDVRSLQLDTEPLPADLTAYDLITDGDMEQLSLEIEKERSKQWKCLLDTTHFLSTYFMYLSWHTIILYTDLLLKV
jgi:hypothetical protein